ncbi:MAG: NosD domain-containing protein [Nitrososphaera sp.]
MRDGFNHLKVTGIILLLGISLVLLVPASGIVSTAFAQSSSPATPFSPDIFSKQFTGNPLSQPSNSQNAPQAQRPVNSSAAANSTAEQSSAKLQSEIFAAQSLNNALGQQSVNQSKTLQAETQQSSACGQKIFKNTTLTSNIICNGSAFIAASNGITISLNGYTITGMGITKDNPSNSKGIGITNKADVRILGPGVIRGFDKGVAISGGRGSSVVGVILQSNNNGIGLSSTNSTVLYGNLIMNNKAGIASQSSNSGNMSSNIVTGNKDKGISLSDSNGFTIDNNVLNQNANNGVILDSQSTNNQLARNAFVSNNIDINNAFGLLPSVNDNSFIDNNCLTSSPTGLCFGR